MGFLILNYSLQGLQPQRFYVSIQGNFVINKNTGPIGSTAGLNMPGLILPYYTVSFTVYYSASKEDPVITQKNMYYFIQALPNPTVLYPIIYEYIKGQLDLYYQTPQQTLVFQDDL